jgi:hypothetical protein
VNAMTTDNASKPDEQLPDIAVSARYRLPLPPHPVAAEQARILVRLALAQWSLDDIADNALVVATELVANAAKLGDVFHLTLSCLDGNILIEVSDSSEAAPERQRQSVDRVDGRGLLLVEGCSKDWGWRQEQTGGKTVWALVGDPDAEPASGTATLRSTVRM